MPPALQASPQCDIYVYIIQVETLTEGSRHYSVIQEKPVTKLIGVHTTLRSANRAAKHYARDDEDLPGGGERSERDINEKYDKNGCYRGWIDATRFSTFTHDIVDIQVRVKRVLLEGLNLAAGEADTPTTDEDDDDDEDEDEEDEDEDEKRHANGIKATLATRELVWKQHQRTQHPPAARSQPIAPRPQPAAQSQPYGGSAVRPEAPVKRPLPAPTDDDEIQFIKEVKRPRGQYEV
jgi:hypothetical protein